jgi:hypothetical protein
MNGRAFLEKVVKEQWAGGKGKVNRWELQGLARGLVAAGVLDQQDADQVMTWLRTKMTEAGMLRTVRFDPVPAVAPRMPAVPVDSPLVDTPVPELKRVISLAGRTFTINDITTSLVSLEVWNTMLILRTARPNDREEPPGLVDDRLRWRGWDDIGTEYRSNTATGATWNSLVVDSRMYEPGPPDEAKIFTMVVEHPDHQALVELPLAEG